MGKTKMKPCYFRGYKLHDEAVMMFVQLAEDPKAFDLLWKQAGPEIGTLVALGLRYYQDYHDVVEQIDLFLDVVRSVMKISNAKLDGDMK